MKPQKHMAFQDEANQTAIIRIILNAVKDRVKTAEHLYQSALALLYAGWTQFAGARTFSGNKVCEWLYIGNEDAKGCMFCSTGAVGAVGYQLYKHTPSLLLVDMYDLRDEVFLALQDELIARRTDPMQAVAVTDFNDSHTFGEVMQWWRDAGARKGWKFEIEHLPPVLREQVMASHAAFFAN